MEREPDKGEVVDEARRRAGPLKSSQLEAPAGKLTVRMLKRKGGQVLVAWTLKPITGRKTAGLRYAGTDLREATSAYDAALRFAMERGWQPAISGLRFAEIPDGSVGPDAGALTAAQAGRVLSGAKAKPRKKAGAITCSKCHEAGHNARTCQRSARKGRRAA